VDARAGELLGQVLRETTTEILRHAQARQVRITLSRGGIAIVNDGAAEDGRPVPHGGGVPHAEDPGGRPMTTVVLADDEVLLLNGFALSRPGT
jgi:hypothetical protein